MTRWSMNADTNEEKYIFKQAVIEVVNAAAQVNIDSGRIKLYWNSYLRNRRPGTTLGAV